jgi:hypothetical protein
LSKAVDRPHRRLIRTRALAIAATQLGVHEVGFNNRGPKVAQYLKEVGLGEGYAWCDAFVSWCLHRAAGHRLPVESAGVGVTYQKARELGWVRTRPFAGDLVLYDFDSDNRRDDHIGFVEKVLGGVSKRSPIWFLRTIEGNTSSGKSGSQADGGGVYRRWRVVRKSSVAFVRVPGYVTV